jgi:glycosyltransferase involved in cell wall biosynthesis
VRNLAAALLPHFERFFTFLYEEGVEPANNSAEGALHCAVEWRKISFGRRSAQGEVLSQLQPPDLLHEYAVSRPAAHLVALDLVNAHRVHGKPAPGKPDLFQVKEVCSRPVSLVLVSSSYPPVLGGSEVEAQRVCTALIGRGHRVTVLCMGEDPMPYKRNWVDPEGVPVRIIGRRWPRKLRGYVFALGVAWRLFVRRRDYELVYFLMQGLHLATGLLVCRALGKPVVMKISGSGLIPIMERSWLGRLELRWLGLWAHRVMVLNEGMEQEAIGAGFHRAQLLWMPNPVDIDAFAPVDAVRRREIRQELGIGQDSPVVLFVGRLAPEKEIPSLLSAMKVVAARLPHALLILVGDGPERPSLEAQVAASCLQANVRFCGRQTTPEVIQWLRACDVFTLVSSHEGLPCSLLEAMSVALPSVVSDIPGNRQLVQPGVHGLYTPVGDSNVLASGIMELLEHPEMCARMGRLARERVITQYSTDRVLDRYETLFREATGVGSSNRGRVRAT